MLYLDEELIKEHCSNIETYSRGKRYFQNNSVTSLKLFEDRQTFEAMVAGTYRYRVSIRLDSDWKLLSTYCNCPAFYSYDGFCKHIVAVLLKIKNQYAGVNFKQQKTNKVIRDMLYLASNNAYEIAHQKDLKLLPTVIINKIYGGYSFSISLRLGEEKLYVVKDLVKFFEAKNDKELLPFGKNFTYNPRIHGFSARDSEIIDLVQEVYELNKLIPSIYPSRSSTSGLVKGKEALLSSSMASKLFNALKGKLFSLDFFDERLENVTVIEEDLPIKFALVKKDKRLTLDMLLQGDLIPLTADGRFYLYQQKVYHISAEQEQNLTPFLYGLNKLGSTLEIPEEYHEEFVARLYSVLPKAGKVELNEEFKHTLYDKPLVSEIYLDEAAGAITADIKYIYGDYTFSPIEQNLKKLDQEEDRFIIRNTAKEQQIINYFEEAEFKLNGQQIYLEDEDKIFDFISETIPQLQQVATVYYSDKLRKRQIRPTPTFKGRVGLNADSDLLEVSFELEGVSREELVMVLNSLREKRKYHRLKDGSFLSLTSESLEEMGEFFETLDLRKSDFKLENVRLPKYRSLQLEHLFEKSKLSFFAKDLNFENLISDLKNPYQTGFQVPTSLEGTLREYQKYGFKWLQTMAKYGFGCILADEMGLGKTLQAIAFITSERERGKKPFLVIAPTSVIYNWQAELVNFAPRIKAIVVSGNKEDRTKLLEEAEEFDVVITSYALLRRDIEFYSTRSYEGLILDEAQYIKNPNSLTSTAAKAISAKTRLALTGTPIENSLTELWSIFDCIMPGYLSSYNKFMEKYGKLIEKENDEEASKGLAKKVSPFILRRLKKEVLTELPEKIEHRLISELTQEQKKLYLAHLEKTRDEITGELLKSGFAQSKLKILAALTRLRQICCHPSLFIADYKGDSGKLQQLKEVVLDALAGGHRLLIFSQFTQMLKIIGQVLKKEKIDYFYLDGSVKSEKRMEMVEAFNTGEKSLFLISLKAGGTGLNLTGADMVIHFDPWWNPAVEDQASDRAHRIGQKRSVQVMKLISLGTIEEKIYALQQKKKELIDKVLQPGEQMLSSLKEEDIREILDL